MRPTVIFISSAGHSGSTLLDMMIGSDSALSCGELRNYNKFFPSLLKPRPKPQHEAKTFNHCSCGANFDFEECPLWNNLDLPESFIITLLKDYNFKYKMFSYKFGKLDIHRITSVTDYLTLLKKLYLKFGYSEFVDSSKSQQWLSMLARLHANRDIDLKVVHLKRRCGGVFYSHKKVRRNPYLSLAGRAFIGFVTRTICEEERIPVIKVKYETLCNNPDSELLRISNFAGVSVNPNLKSEYHLIGGNPMRFKGVSEIRLDEKWKKKLSLGEKLVCKIFEIFT